MSSVATARLELCQPADPDTRPPQLVCPPRTVDCHVHVYGPDDRYPVSRTRLFDVPEASPRSLADMLDTLGVERVVLVQPSGYGFDNSRQIDGMAQVERPARAVAALRADVSDAELARLHALGVRGVRYAAGHNSGAPLVEMPRLAARIADMGWHVQLHVFTHGLDSPLVELEPMLAALPTPVVIDHIGSVVPAAGLDQPGFQALLRLCHAGRCWTKLSGGYRISGAPPYADVAPYVAALVDARPDRLVWASDWPHVFFNGVMPNDADLLDQMLVWVPDERIRNRIFADNPATLYDFDT